MDPALDGDAIALAAPSAAAPCEGELPSAPSNSFAAAETDKAAASESNGAGLPWVTGIASLD
jgi:hypothetical protein